MTSLLALALLTGCGGKVVDAHAPAMTPASAAAFWKTYCARNNAAMVEAGPPLYFGSAYAGVDTGATMQLDLTSIRIKKLTHAPRSTPFSETVQAVYAPTADRGFAVNLVHSDSRLDAPPVFKSLVGSGTSFKNEMDVYYSNGTLPTALPPGRASTPDGDDLARADRVLGTIRDYWRTGQKPVGIDLDGMAGLPFLATRRALLGDPRVEDRMTVDGPFATSGRGRTVRVVKVRGGLLAMAAYQVEARIVASDGVVLRRTGPDLVLSGKPQFTRSDTRYAVVLAVSVPDRGEPTVLGDNEFPLV